MFRSDVIAAGLLLVLSAAVFVVSADFPGGRGGDPGAAFFPRLITGTIAILALGLLVKDLTAEERAAHEIDPAIVRRLVIVVAFPTIYILAMPIVGFPLTTIAFLAGLMWFSGARSIPMVLGSAVGVTLVLYYLFGALFQVPLPEGLIPIGDVLPFVIHAGLI
ncbi:tripartite tricarboxylate transporter TctB family protein [Halalkalicoccus subterraneus]|uniref:tripartite tricarboxylate transporter TctB family protein n=1 Tax=Halalkalicoccus subterraneus TaxID=2675002 RepID=UPI001FE2C8D8|nr:tripartite tricarboxylate transporter TctB family protein [Halalkalicoccus subterraneus]